MAALQKSVADEWWWTTYGDVDVRFSLGSGVDAMRVDNLNAQRCGGTKMLRLLRKVKGGDC